MEEPFSEDNMMDLYNDGDSIDSKASWESGDDCPKLFFLPQSVKTTLRHKIAVK